MNKPIPGHEEHNCDHLAKHQLAIRICDLQEVDRWIETLLFFPETFERLYENMKQYQQKMNPLAGVNAVINLLSQ